MARVIGRPAQSAEEGANRFVEALLELMERCGVADESFQKYGVPQEALERLADNCWQNFQGLLAEDRVSLTKEDVRRIYRAAFERA